MKHRKVVIILLLVLLNSLVGIQLSRNPLREKAIKARFLDFGSHGLNTQDNGRSLLETDDLGGSWFDDFVNSSALERMDNVSQYDNGIMLMGNRSRESWHYNGWLNRTVIEIDNPSGQYLSGYQVDLSVPFIPGMQSDFDDLRFTYLNENDGTEVPLPHWVQEYSNSICSKIWINITEIHADTSTTLFMYYGNDEALNTSNGDSTFLFFDDFSGPSIDLNKWIEPHTGSQASYSIDDGNLFLEVSNVWVDAENCFKKTPVNLDDRIVESRQKMEEGGTKSGNAITSCLGLGMGETNLSWSRLYGRSNKENTWLKYTSSDFPEGTMWDQSTWDGGITPYHILGLAKDGDEIGLFEDSKLITVYEDTGITEDEYKLWINNKVYGYAGNGFGRMWTDWFRIRNHITPEPVLHFLPNEGSVRSKSISLPQSMSWEILSLDKSEPVNTNLCITVVDADTNTAVAGYDKLPDEIIDLSGLNSLGITNISLLGIFSGNGSATPLLESWGVEWVAQNAWRDSFTGNGKLVIANNVKISNEIQPIVLDKIGFIRSELIFRPENMVWNGLYMHLSLPKYTTLDILVNSGVTDEILMADSGSDGDLYLDLSSIDSLANSAVYLQANLISASGQSPVLYDWGIRYSVDSAEPVAVAGNDLVIDQNDIVYFNGSASYDNVGLINYTWSFLYGLDVINLYGMNAEFCFKDAGLFPVTLMVSDAAGYPGADEILVTVRDSTPPLAKAGTDMIVHQYTYFIFNGSASSDNMGIMNFSWSFEYDDEVINLYGEETSFYFVAPGIYVITLELFDFNDNRAEDSFVVHVQDKIKPTAMAGDDMVTNEGELIILNGNGSTDNDGIENYSWFFVDNGDFVVLYGQNVSHVFSTTGEYLVTLVVRDSDKNLDTDNMTVFVGQNNETSAEEETDTDGDGYSNTYENASGSDPYDPKSIPLDWDGDGVRNEWDAYPRDPSRWLKEDGGMNYLNITIYLGLGLILFLICFIGYTRISQKNIFNHRTRVNICSYIQEHPGLYFRELSRRMNINSSTLHHHIRKLEEANVINAISDGYLLRYYFGKPGDDFPSLTPAQEKMISLISNNSGITYKQLIDRTNLSYPTISYHVSSLVDRGVITKVKNEGLIHLYVNKIDF